MDIEKIIQNGRDKWGEKLGDFERRSKQLYELVATEKFAVREVTAIFHKIKIPNSDIIFSGKLNSGYVFVPEIFLKVSSDNPDVPVRLINFLGSSPVITGNCISVKIPKYEEERLNGLDFEPRNMDRIFYFDRKFKSYESAIEVAILSPDGKVIRRDRSPDYEEFIEK